MRIVPNTRTTKTPKLARDLHYYKPLIQRLSVRGGDLRVEYTHHFWEIRLTPDDVFFQTDIPTKLLERHFQGATLLDEDHPMTFTDHTAALEMELDRHFMFSLRVDKGVSLISALLETKRQLEEGEVAFIQYILTPESHDWHLPAAAAYHKFRQGKMPLQTRITVGALAKQLGDSMATLGAEIANTVQELLIPDPKERDLIDLNDVNIAQILREKPLSNETISKTKHNAFNVNIRLLAQSPNKARLGPILHSLQVSFKSLDGDNYLVPKTLKLTPKLKRKVTERLPSFSFVKTILSTEEVDKLLTLPESRDLVEHNITRIDTREVSVARSITRGNIVIGTATERGRSYNCYWPEHFDYISLPKIVVGKMGGGKSTYTVNFAVDAAKAGHGVIVLDFIKECELSEQIKRHVDPKRLVEIDVSDMEANHALTFPELTIRPDMTKWDKIKRASDFSGQVGYLINALNDGQLSPLTPKMSRVLDASCQVAYLSGRTRIMDVFQILTDYEIRNRAIETVVREGIYLEDYHRLTTLRSLDEPKGGTKEAKIEGIIDRINILMRNVFLERMLGEEGTGESFVDYMDQGKVVLIKMRQSEFKDTWVKDTLCTYYLTRIWLATLIRGTQNRPRINHVITDEIHQLENATKVIFDHITESRKFGVGYFFTCQYLNQFRSLLQAVEGAGANYMLTAGTHKANFELLKEERGEFTVEELLEMKEYHSFNIIQVPNGYERFIAKMPKPL